MDKDFASVEGMFKTNTDIVSKALATVSPERWRLGYGQSVG